MRKSHRLQIGPTQTLWLWLKTFYTTEAKLQILVRVKVENFHSIGHKWERMTNPSPTPKISSSSSSSRTVVWSSVIQPYNHNSAQVISRCPNASPYVNAGADPGFPGDVSTRVGIPTYYSAKNLPKTTCKWNKLDGRMSLAPPLRPVTFIVC